MRELIIALSDMLEDDLPAVSAMQERDPKRKYARLPKQLRPSKSKYKPRATLMNTTNPEGRGAPGEIAVNVGFGQEDTSVSLDRLIQELAVQVASTYTSARDEGDDRIAKRDAKVDRQIRKNASKARGSPDHPYPYNKDAGRRAMHRTAITTSRYGSGF